MSHMGGCYSKLDKKSAEARNSRLPTPGAPGVKTAAPLTPSSSSTALSPPRRVESRPRPASGVSLRSRLFGSRTSTPTEPTRPSSFIPRRGSADQRNNNSTNVGSTGSTNSIARRASAASNGSAGAPPVRSPSGTSISSAGGRSASRLPAPGSVSGAKAVVKSDANANPSPKVDKTTRRARSRSGNREHPYSRQSGSGKVGEEESAPPSTNLAVQELQRLTTDDTYKAFKVRRRRYISAPRSCYDNYNAENYTKRLSSETATSAGSSESDRTLMSAGSSDKQKSASDVTPSPSLTDSSPFPKEEVKDAPSAADHTPPEKSSSATTVASPPAAPAPNVPTSSANPERASLAVSTGVDQAPSPAITEARSPCGSQPLSIDSAQDTPRPSALSVSSLNSDDLMLTTDIGLDLEDDDIIKDIDDTEKEDPFVVANALATASGRNARRGAAESEGGAVRSPPSPRGAASSNLTTPETISSAMSLVRQATGPAAGNSVMTTSMPGRLPGSPKPSLLRKKSMPAPAASDSAKSAVLRRFRAQSNAERPRSFSSPLRPPLRSRLSSASSASGQPGASDGAASSDELPVLLCQSDYRHLTQDMKSVKLLLLRLKGMLLEDEGHQPPFLEQLNSFAAPNNNLCTSTSSIKRSDSASEPSTPLTGDPFSPSAEDPPLDLETASREALVQEVLMMRRNTVYLRAKLAEREQTVKLLQQQMTKYVCAGTNETPSSTEQFRSFARHNFVGKFALDGPPSGGTEPPSPVVDPPCPQASASASSLPNGDAIGLSPRPASRLRHGAARRERENGQPLRPSFLPVNPQSKRTLSTGHLPHRKSNTVMSTSAQL